MNENEVSNQILRIYLSGNNTPFDPWHLSPYLPHKYSIIISLHQYKIFTEECNETLKKCSSKFGNILYIIVCIIAYPLSLSFLNVLRKQIIQKFIAFINSYQLQFVYYNNGLKFFIKFGFCSCYSRGYIDLLYYGQPRDLPSQIQCGLQFPLVIPCCGTGSIVNPYCIDAYDVIVRSIPHSQSINVFIDQPWYEFCGLINLVLQTFNPMCLPIGIEEVYKFLINYKDNNILKQAGLNIKFGRFWLGFDPDDEKTFSANKYCFGILITQKQTRPNSCDLEKISIRDLALGLKRVPINPKRAPRRMSSTDELLLIEDNNNEDLIDTTLPIPGILYSSHSDVPKPSTYHKMIYYISRCFPHLESSNKVKHDLFVWLLLLLLLLIDSLLYVSFAVEFWCLRSSNSEGETCSRLGIIIYMLIPPLTGFISIMYGIYSVLMQISYHLKRFLLWNLFSNVSIIVCIILLPFATDKVVVTLLIIISFINKNLITVLGNKFISYLDRQREKLHLSYSISHINEIKSNY